MTAPGGAPRRCGAAPVELTPSAELQRLMRAWRERLELRGAPSPNRPLRPTQDDLARLVGVSSTWYRSLERGIPANYSDEFLDRVADVLQLDAGDRQLLYLLAAGRLPPPLARPPGWRPAGAGTALQARPGDAGAAEPRREARARRLRGHHRSGSEAPGARGLRGV